MSGQQIFPPPGPTTLQQILAAYVYQEYADDDNIQAFNAAFNGMAQSYLDWFNQINLPVYTAPTIVGPLLDWVGAGIYGLPRPSLASGQIVGIGPLNTWMLNTWVLNSFVSSGSVQNPTVNDDIYKRIITWWFYKGDGFQFTIPWLKRRIMRFLIGTNGVAPNIDNTYPVSIAFNGGENITITITLTDAYPITVPTAQIFQLGIQTGALCMPFQLSEVVVIVNDLGATGLDNDGGFLVVTAPAGWPSNPSGLTQGAVWNNGTFASVVPGQTPNPFAQPQYFGLISAGALLVLGGGDLPLADPHVVDQLWNNGGLIAVSSG